MRTFLKRLLLVQAKHDQSTMNINYIWRSLP